jgi:hypothetical protein
MKNSARVRNQHMLSMKKFVVLAGAILLSMQATRAAEPAIYRETFSATAGAPNTNFNYVGWNGYWSPTAQPDDGIAIPYNNFGAGSSLGRPSGGSFTNVNAGPEDGNTNGFAFASGQLAVSNNFLNYTSQFPIDQTLYNIGSISFYSGNTSNSFPNGMPGYRIAIQMDGNWYASSQLLVQNNNIANAAAFATSGQQLIFNWTLAAGAWDSLTFVPGTSLVLGGPTGALPSDPVTAYGLYSDPAVNTNGALGVATRRWDSYEIDGTVIPEPSSLALVFLGLGALWSVRRSRKA